MWRMLKFLLSNWLFTEEQKKREREREKMWAEDLQRKNILYAEISKHNDYHSSLSVQKICWFDLLRFILHTSYNFIH